MKTSGLLAVFFCAVFFCHGAVPANWYSTPAMAQSAANAKQLPIMVVFAGGEWCQDSTEFRNKIASNNEFLRLFHLNSVPLFVELPPASRWSSSFKAQLKEQYAFLPIENGIPLPAIYFTDASFNDLRVREPSLNFEGFRNALERSRKKLSESISAKQPAVETKQEEKEKSAVRKSSKKTTKVKKEKVSRADANPANNVKSSENSGTPGYTAQDQMREAQSQRSRNRNPKADPPEGWFTDPAKAKEFAAKRNLPILMLFSGTDWCPPCRALRAKVLDKKDVQKLVTRECVALYVHVPSNGWNRVRSAYPFWRGGGVPSFLITDANFKVIRGVNVRQRSYYGIKVALKEASERLK